MSDKNKKIKIRLDKFLTEMDQGTRSQVKDMIRKGRIKVNGQVTKASDLKIDPEQDQVEADGQVVGYARMEYYMLHKPQGVVSATEDSRYPTVVSLIREALRKDLFPVGRLDLDTEGLLLITNDGAMAHSLLSPKKHVDKVYLARFLGQLPPDAGRRFEEGITLEDGTRTLPARLGPVQGDMAELTIREGKFHQVKRMFEALGCHVTYLKRISMGPLKLDEGLKPGEYRPLTEKELEALKACTEGKNEDKSVYRSEDRAEEGTEAAPVSGDLLASKRAVLFDLDGTLVDSMWMWKTIDIEYLGRYGLACPEDLQKEIEGMSFTETAVYFKKRFSLPDSLEEIKEAWIQMSLDKYRHQVPLKPGAREFLDYIRARGLKAGIATSNGTAMVEAVLDSLQIREYFQTVITACEVAAGKPAPDIYLKVAEELGVEPEDCVVFEDVPAGILAGKRAGMTVVAVEDDFSRHMRREKEQLADYFIEDYTELLEASEA